MCIRDSWNSLPMIFKSVSVSGKLNIGAQQQGLEIIDTDGMASEIRNVRHCRQLKNIQINLRCEQII